MYFILRFVIKEILILITLLDVDRCTGIMASYKNILFNFYLLRVGSQCVCAFKHVEEIFLIFNSRSTHTHTHTHNFTQNQPHKHFTFLLFLSVVGGVFKTFNFVQSSISSSSSSFSIFFLLLSSFLLHDFNNNFFISFTYFLFK